MAEMLTYAPDLRSLTGRPGRLHDGVRALRGGSGAPAAEGRRPGRRAGGRERVDLRPMWPPEALEFLRELEDNNDRDWFKANRARYDEHLVEPARALAANLAHLGQPRLFRPCNDARFGNRPPLKEQLGDRDRLHRRGRLVRRAVARRAARRRRACTIPRPTSSSASARRSTTRRRAKAFERALQSARATPAWRSSTRSSSARRAATRQHHPRIEHLRRKHLTVFRRHAARAVAARAGLHAARRARSSRRRGRSWHGSPSTSARRSSSSAGR